MKQLLLFTSILATSSSAFAYESTYDKIEWGSRGTDSNYCLDITNKQGKIAYGLKAIACGEGLHQFSPQKYVREVLGTDLPAGFDFYWKVWSPTGYGQAGFEGRVVVGGGSCQGLPYNSDAQNIQWDCRAQDVHYCVDIFDSNNQIISQAVACGDGLHSYSPSVLNLASGNYGWKIWSNGGYGGAGFEGTFQVGAENSSLAVGGKLYDDNCSTCHGINPASGRNNIRRGSDPMVSRRAINNNIGGMNYLSFLTDAELANIAAYIQNPNPKVPSILARDIENKAKIEAEKTNTNNDGRETNQANEGRETNQANEGRETNQANEGRESNQANEGREGNETNEGREGNESREGNEANEGREFSGSRG